MIELTKDNSQGQHSSQDPGSMVNRSQPRSFSFPSFGQRLRVSSKRLLPSAGRGRRHSGRVVSDASEGSRCLHNWAEHCCPCVVNIIMALKTQSPPLSPLLRKWPLAFRVNLFCRFVHC